MSPAVSVIIGLALIVFLWGIIKYMRASGDEKEMIEGRNMMIYGIIGLFVMVSVLSLTEVFRKTFGI